MNHGKRLVFISITALICIFLYLSTADRALSQSSGQADTLKIKNYIQLSKSQAREGNFAESVKNGLIADSLAASSLYLPEIHFYEFLTRIMYRYDTNIFQFRLSKKLVHMVDKVEDPVLKARYLEYIGWIYFHFRKYRSSEDYFLKCLEIIEENDLERKYPSAYEGLATVYNNTDMMDQAMKYYRKYIQHADPDKEEIGLYYVNFSLGDKYRLMGQHDSAFKYFNFAYDIAREIQDSAKMAAIISRMAYNFYEAGNLSRSLDYYLKNIEFLNKIDFRGYLENQYGNIGNIYRDRKQYDLAIENYNKSIDIALEERSIYNLSWVYHDLAELYAKQNKYEKAYESMQKAREYSDTLAMMHYREGLAREISRREDIKRQKELEILNMMLEQNRTLNYSLAAGLVLMLVIGLMIFRQNKIRAKHRIEKMKQQITELSQKNLLQQMNPHFIFNTLNSIQFYMFRNDKVASNNYMNKFARLMRMVLENSQHAAIPISRDLDALKLYIELEVVRFKEKFSWNIDVDNEIDTLTFKVPPMLIQPYVENAITHGIRYKEGKGHIRIALQQENNHIRCVVEDDGIGRKAAERLKKERNGNHNSLGTKITESRMKLVRSLYGDEMRVEYTDLYDEARNGCGTRVELHIPIIND